MKCLPNSERTALVAGERRISFNQLIANAVAASGFLPSGDDAGRVALIGTNSPSWVTALYGIWHARRTVIPIDFMSTPEEIAFILDDCTPIAIWSDAASREKVTTAIGIMSNRPPKLLMLEDISESPADAAMEFGENPSEDIALIVYTSGTTGNPKGVMLSFGNLQVNTDACTTQIHVFNSNDRVLVALPLHHTYPLMATVVMPLSIGARCVFTEALTGEAILKALHDNQCTFIVGVPRMLELLRNGIMRKINASFLGRCLYAVSASCHSLWLSRKLFAPVQKALGNSIRYVSSGGAAADPDVTRDFYALGLQLLEGYGMTETAPMISFTPPWQHKPGSPGIPIPCNEVKISDGEVLVRGKNVMKGYYHRPEETAQAIDSDGWLHTGDLGYIDEDGFLFLTGRSKELIILGNGKNISPDELEQKIMTHTDGLVTECAVTALDGALTVVMVPDKPTLEKRKIINIEQTLLDQIIEPYNETAPSYKRIQRIVLCQNPLPRTRLGKLRRHLLADCATRTSRPLSKPAPTDTVYTKVAAIISECVAHPIGPDDHIELDLALDSLGKLEVLSVLNAEYGDWIQPELLAECATARMLADIIRNHEQCQSSPVQAQPESTLRTPAWTMTPLAKLAKLILHSLEKIDCKGMENIPDGPCIFAPNHQSFLDAPVLVTVLNSKRLRNTYFYAMSKYVEGGIKGAFLKAHNIVSMDLNGDLAASLKQLETALSHGKSVVIFPEGTRTMDGSVGAFHHTFAKLARSAAVPVVPIAIHGAFEAWPRQNRLPRLGQDIHLEFLPPMAIRPDESLQDFSHAVEEAVRTAVN